MLSDGGRGAGGGEASSGGGRAVWGTKLDIPNRIGVPLLLPCVSPLADARCQGWSGHLLVTCFGIWTTKRWLPCSTQTQAGILHHCQCRVPSDGSRLHHQWKVESGKWKVESGKKCQTRVQKIKLV